MDLVVCASVTPYLEVESHSEKEGSEGMWETWKWVECSKLPGVVLAEQQRQEGSIATETKGLGHVASRSVVTVDAVIDLGWVAMEKSTDD